MYMNLKPSKYKIISFNTTTMTSLGFIVVGTPPPHPHPLLKGGVGLSKNWVTWGNFFLERGDKPVKGGGGVATFLLIYSSIIFTVSVSALI